LSKFWGVLYTGHKYWSRFDSKTQTEIESLAKSINELLFTPELRTPIKTLDLPVAGRGYSSKTLPLVFDLVNIMNNIGPNEVADDPNGTATIGYLKTCQKILNRITGTHPSSLGLHPVVYFYSITGRYQPTAFFAIIEFVKELERTNGYKKFISIRKQFEDFIVKYKMLPLQVVYKHGSGLKGYLSMKDLFSFIHEAMINGKDETLIIGAMAKDPKLSYLQPNDISGQEFAGADFTTETKSAAFLRDALKEPLRCGICGGLIHFNSISIDHIQRRKDGGLGTINNAQLTHPFCNTGVKN
jgi:hypothetical protein